MTGAEHSEDRTMTDTRDDLLPRREFLRRSARLVSATAAALNAHASLAATPQSDTTTTPALSLAFWDGARLIPADRLPSGDATLGRNGVRLVVRAMRIDARRLTALDAHYFVSLDGSDAHFPYHAWAANPHGPAHAAFTMPVAPDGTVRLSAHHAGEETRLPLTTGTLLDAPKLRAGCYVLALGVSNWGAYQFRADADLPLVRRTLSGFVPASLEYLVLSVSPA
jgi:hypothetical protein